MAKAISENLVYYEDEILGRGSSSFVFKGCFGEDKIPVAIKRTRLSADGKSSAIQKQREEAISALVHPNVARLYSVEEDTCFKYLALEQCHGSLDKYFSQELSQDALPRERDGIAHLADGLNYIHSKGLVYFDVKPTNVLIFVDETCAMFKWADFGLQQVANNTRGTFFSGGVQGSHCWLAPEILALLNEQQNVTKSKQLDTPGRKEATVWSDVFSLGLICFSFIMGGMHMFGAKNLIAPNILGKRRVNLNKLEREHFAYDMIDGMTKPQPAFRITLMEVIQQLS